MYQAFDFFGRHEIPQIWLCNPDQSKIGSLKAAYNVKPTLRFNEMSEISLTFPEHIEENGEYIRLDVYDSIESKRLIYVEELGYFLIHGITETDNGVEKTKDVNAYSLECELSFKKVNLISGTHQFWNPTDQKASLLGKVFDSIPSWSVEHVDVELWDLWRTFEVPDATVYNFLMENIEKSYECVFTFNTFNRTVSAYTLQNATKQTDIYMSFDTLIEQIEVEELSDEIVTALKVYGDSELDISGVNPLGTPTIYNFNYYKTTEWMSQGLIDALNKWEQKIRDNTQPYKNALLDIKNANTKLYVKSGTSSQDDYSTTIGNGTTTTFTITHNLGTTCPSVLVRDLSTSGSVEPSTYTIIYSASTPNSFRIVFNTAPAINNIEITVRNTGLYVVQATTQETYDSLMQVKAARIDAGISLTDINAKIAAANAQLVVINSAIKVQTDILDNRNQILQRINNELKMSNSFTQAQLIELDPFIIENTYQNTAFIKTDTMTLVEVQDMQEQLLEQGQTILQRVSTPRYTFAVSSANFLFLKEFQQFAQQLTLGSIMYVRVSESLVATPILLQLEYSFDNPDEFTLTFGNRYRLDDSAYVFSDLFNDAINAGVSSNFNQELWQKFVSSGADVKLNDLLTEAWDAAKNEIINAANQQIVIDGAGLRGKMQLKDGSYDNRQVWLTGKSLAFTKDNWNTVSLALGEITLGRTKHYGLAAEAVVGQLLAGSNLLISNGVKNPDTGEIENTTFSIDSNGFHASAGDFSLTTNDQKNQIIFNSTDGFKIRGRANASSTWIDKLYLDNAGNLQILGNGSFTGDIYANNGYFKGDITGASGTFTGKIIANEGKIGGFSLMPDGSLTSPNMTLYAVNTERNIKIGSTYIGENIIEFGGTGDSANFSIGGGNGVPLFITSNGQEIRLINEGKSITYNLAPLAVGLVGSGLKGVDTSKMRLEIICGQKDMWNATSVDQQFSSFNYGATFSTIPCLVGTPVYNPGAMISGAVSVKFRDIGTSSATMTLGGTNVSWSDLYNVIDYINWIGIGFAYS